MKQLLLLLTVGAGMAFAQDPQGPTPGPGAGPQGLPPAPPPPPGAPGTPGPRNVPGRIIPIPGGIDGRVLPPGSGGGGDQPFRPFAEMRKNFEGGGGMDMLNEEDRRRIRTAMEAVWNSESVKAARDSAADSAKKYRDALHDAAIANDPSIKPLLDKIASKMERGPFGPDARGPGGENRGPEGRGPGSENRGPENRGPAPQTGGQPSGQPAGVPNGPPNNEGGDRRGQRQDGGMRIPGLDPQEIAKLPEELRRMLPQVVEKIMQSPEVKEAREKLEAAAGEEKREAFRKVRDVVRTLVEKDFPALAKAIGEIRGKGGNPPDGKPQPGGADAPPPPPPSLAPAPPANTPGAPEKAPTPPQ